MLSSEQAIGLVLVCVAAAADTGVSTNTWRQCSSDRTPAAIEACTTIILLDPGNDGAYVNRGLAYRRQGDLHSAIRDYDKAIEINPRAADAFNNRGNAYQGLRDHERAMRDYREAIRLNPAYTHAYNNRGVSLLERDELELALAEFTLAIGKDPSYSNAFRNRGLVYAHQGLYERAVEDFDEALRLDPALVRGVEYAVALYGRGLAREQRGDRDGVADLEAAKRLVPDVADLMSDR
jgi:tetratricopeptide (TPR) repeat protein